MTNEPAEFKEVIRLPKDVFIKDGIEVKVCKQCRRTLNILSFRRNVSRSKVGKYKTVVGYHTICSDCEEVEQFATRLYKKKEQAEASNTLLDSTTLQNIEKVVSHYQVILNLGYPLITKYAKLIVGQNDEQKQQKLPTFGFVATKQSNINQDEALMDDMIKLLEMEWTEDPDVYDKMIEDLKERALQDPNNLYSKIRPEYSEVYNKLVDKWSDYEDNYDWSK